MILQVYIQPGAKKNEIVGLHNGALKIKIKAPPVDGKANETLIDFLADFFGVPKKRLEIISGEKSRNKKISISGEDQKIKKVLAEWGLTV